MTMKYKNFLLLFNLLIEAESDKISNGEDAEDRTPDTLITMAARILQLLHNNIDLIKTSRYYKKRIKKIKIIYCKR